MNAEQGEIRVTKHTIFVPNNGLSIWGGTVFGEKGCGVVEAGCARVVLNVTSA